MALTDKQKQLAINQYNNAIDSARQQFYGSYYGVNSVKHDKSWCEYGYPEQIDSQMLYQMYRRHPLAKAGIDKRADKKWQTMPEVCSGELDDKKVGRDKKRDEFETAIDKLAQSIHLWSKLKEIEKRASCGRYAVGVMLLRDGQPLNTPVKPSKKPLGLKKIIPLWSAQINDIIFDNDPTSERYLEPKYFEVNQRKTDNSNLTSDNYAGIVGRVHWSRCLWDFWGVDDDVKQSYSLLEAGYNDLLDTVKIAGGGGEGFWKNAARQLGFEFDKDAQISEIAAGLGVAVDDVADALNDQVTSLNNNLDSATIMMGGKVSPINVSLPSSKDFYEVSANQFAASLSMPYKELVGNQTGERASSEDANSWHMTCESERNERTVMRLRQWIDRLIMLNVVPSPKDDVFGIAWASLLDPTPNERAERVKQMSDINKNSMGTGQPSPFTSEEMRTEFGYDNEDYEAEDDEFGEV